MTDGLGDDPWDHDPDERERLERMGRTAAIFGILAMSFAMLMTCSYYLTLVPAIGCGAVAAWMGKQVVDAGIEGAARAYANVGIWTGGIASVFGVLFLLLCGTFIVVYAGFIGLMVAAGSM